MNILADSNIPFVNEAFAAIARVTTCNGRLISRDILAKTDILLVRSITRVDHSLLDGTPVRFVATATIGTDHLDIPWLEQAGIAWCYAPGCNANSVSEYVTAALLCLAQRHGWTLAGRTLGLIGVGNVGRRVAQKARALGLNVLQNDPPRARAEGGAGFVSLEELLAAADIVSLHVPLTREGPDATWHLADEAFFRRLRRGAVFLNCARGAVVCTEALLAALQRGQVAQAVIDTWEGEPDWSRDLMRRCDLATPHIAGHSFDGRVAGTVMVYRGACRFLGRPAVWTPEGLLPPPDVPEVVADAGGRSEEGVLFDIVRQVYDIEADDRRLRESACDDAAERRRNFDRLRREYPRRREFPWTRVVLRNAGPALAAKVEGLGFQRT